MAMDDPLHQIIQKNIPELSFLNALMMNFLLLSSSFWKSSWSYISFDFTIASAVAHTKKKQKRERERREEGGKRRRRRRQNYLFLLRVIFFFNPAFAPFSAVTVILGDGTFWQFLRIQSFTPKF